MLSFVAPLKNGVWFWLSVMHEVYKWESVCSKITGVKQNVVIQRVTSDNRCEIMISAKWPQIHLNGCQLPDRAKLFNAKPLTQFDRSCPTSGSKVSSPVENQMILTFLLLMGYPPADWRAK